MLHTIHVARKLNTHWKNRRIVFSLCLYLAMLEYKCPKASSQSPEQPQILLSQQRKQGKCSFSFPPMTKPSLSTRPPRHWVFHGEGFGSGPALLPPVQTPRAGSEQSWVVSLWPWGWKSQIALKPPSHKQQNKAVPVINHTVLKWCVPISQCASVSGLCSSLYSYFFCESPIFLSHGRV